MILERLIIAGADVNATLGKEGFAGLQLAAAGGHCEAVKLLLAATPHHIGAGQGRCVALQLAIENKHSGVVEILKKAGCRIRKELYLRR